MLLVSLDIRASLKPKYEPWVTGNLIPFLNTLEYLPWPLDNLVDMHSLIAGEVMLGTFGKGWTD